MIRRPPRSTLFPYTRSSDLYRNRFVFIDTISHAHGSRERKFPGVLLRRYIKDRKSTRLNSSHQIISYAVFCLKKKKYFHSTTPDGTAAFDILATISPTSQQL